MHTFSFYKKNRFDFLLSFTLIILLALILSCVKKKDETIQAKRTANVFILTGQSNAVGQHDIGKIIDNLPYAYRTPQKNILIWRSGNYVDTPKQAGFEPMQVPLNTRSKLYNDVNNPYYNSVGWSVEQDWMNWVQSYYNEDVYLIKSAFGGMSITNWLKPSGTMYQELSSMILGANKSLTNQNKTVKFRGIVWMQGEADVSTKNYLQLFDSTIVSIRSIHDNLKAIPLIMIKIPTSNIYFSKYANDAFDSLATRNPKLNFVINPEDFNDIKQFDKIHFDDYSKLRLGQEVFKLELINRHLE